MSYIVRTYGCDECGGRWDVLANRDDPPPNFCQQCGVSFGDDLPSPLPAKVSIGGSNIVRAVDGTYRSLEETSAARAAENDAPHMKITNMRDNLREGDVPMPPVSNTVTHFMRETEQRFGPTARYGFQGGGAASGEARPTIATGDGQFFGPGHVALQTVQGNAGRDHAARRQAIEAVGRAAKPRE